MADARSDVLARVREALGGHAPAVPDVPRDYRVAEEHPSGHPALIERFVDRLTDYGAGVRRTNEAGIAEAVAHCLADGLARAERVAVRLGRARVVVPDGVPDAWLATADVEVVADRGVGDRGLDADALDALDGVVTGAAVAVAETGTIILDGSPDQGRRALTLVPDLHVCVVRASQLVGGVPAAVARLDPTRPLTWISGPSATSDIELDRVEGVHGPRTLEVVVLADGREIRGAGLTGELGSREQ